ncbi:LysE family translocator [Hahella sp. HN01]|uniref:LysE family translocator n=1 Tax=Hahella sp. HN01 TaxID=2847262 RepID=UPI001C1EA5BF|nr:LysE family translocator [Hahella sp. HN01]MBU6950127.1 LysE family translocator [Hahella sp. HN01]
MGWDVWFMFSLAYLVTTLSPGPNVLLVVKNSFQYGWKSAFVTVLGNLSCQFVIVCLVAIGVGELLEQLPIWFTLMKVLGGAYLIYLGCKSLRAGGKSNLSLPDNTQRASQFSSRKLYTEAFLVSASNPKTLIFLSAFLPQFINAEQSHLEQFGVMYVSICVIVTGIHLGYAMLISRVGQRFLAQDIERKISKVSGGLFITMGGGVLLSQRV